MRRRNRGPTVERWTGGSRHIACRVFVTIAGICWLDYLGSGSAQLWCVASPPLRRGGKIALHLHCVDHSRNAFAAPCLRAGACSNSCKSRRFIFLLRRREERQRQFRRRWRENNLLSLTSTALLPALGRDDRWEVQMVLSKCLARTRRWSDRRRTTPFVRC
jgi:hypothetical protein